VDAVGAEGVGRDGGDQGRVHAAREAEHHIGEPVLQHVVARREHQRVVDLGDGVEQRHDLRHPRRLRVGGDGSRHGDHREGRRGVAAAGVEQAGAEDRPDVEVDDRHRLAQLREAGHDLAVPVDHEGGAVEDELVLPPDLVHVGDVAVGVLGPRGHHALALDVAAGEVRRAVRDDHELGPAGGLLGDRALGAPHVLAHGDAHLHPRDLVELEGTVAGGEVPLLVEHGVVRQEALVVRPHDHPVGTHRGRVAQVPVGVDEADHRRAPARAGGDLVERLAVGGHEAGLQHQILGWVPREGELREHGQVAAGRLRLLVRGQHPVDVAVEVTDHRVDLAQRQADPGHGPSVGGGTGDDAGRHGRETAQDGGGRRRRGVARGALGGPGARPRRARPLGT
jgi:hypothetical protein